MIGQMPYAQAGSGYGQALGERFMGAGLRAGSAGIGLASGAVGLAPLAAMGAGALGVGIPGLAALGGPLGLGVAGGLAVAGYGAGQMMTGFEQRQGVNQVLRSRFGGAVGIGSGRGGRGFSTEEMGGVSTMLREMGTEDVYSSMEELTRVMDRTAQMGVYKGVSSAREFKTKFKQTVDALKEIAQTMNTTLEGASEFMQSSRQMGFFSGQDISRNLMGTRMTAATTGMSVPQIQQIGQMGSQMGMAMGMRGRTGARYAQGLAGQIGAAVQGGALSEEQLFEATGGLTGAEGIQALTGTVMQANQRFLRRGAGRMLTAAAWDPESGGVNREVMEQIQGGEISFQEARRMARRNVSATGGQRSEFFSQEDRIRGEVGAEGGIEMGVGMLEAHLQRRGRGEDFDDPIAQRFLRRQMGYSQSQVEAIQVMRREMPRTMAQSRESMRQEASNMIQTRRREGQGLEGMRRRWSQWWEREIENPIQQAADDMTSTISQGIEGMMNDFEGRIQTSISSQTQSQMQAWARTGERPAGMSMAGMTEFTQEAQRRGAAIGMGGEGGFVADLGRTLGARGPGQAAQLRSAQAYKYGLRANASNQERAEWLQRMQRDLSITATEVGVSSSEMKELGSIALDEVYTTMNASTRAAWIENRSNADDGLRMAKLMIKGLRGNERLREYIDRGRTWHQKMALAADLTDAAGLGILGINRETLSGGGGAGTFRQGLLGAREMQAEAIRKVVELSGSEEGERGEVGWVEGAARVAGTLGVGLVGNLITGMGGETGGDVLARALGFEINYAEGGRMNMGAAKRLLKNTELQQDLRLARKGDKAARQRLTKASLAVGESGAGSASLYGESVRDRRSLRTLIDMTTTGSAEEQLAVDEFLKTASRTQLMLVHKAVRTSAAELSRFTATHAATLEEGMGKEAFAEYQEIIELQESEDPEDLGRALAAEKGFLEQWGGKKEGRFLLARLREGGVGSGLVEGLASMKQSTRQFRLGTEKTKARRLIEDVLGDAGITGTRELRKLFRGGFMGKVIAGEEDPAELAKRLVERMSDPQKLKLADLGISEADYVERLTERIKIGEGGASAGEIQELFGGEAAGRALGTRLGGAPKEQVDTAAESLAETRKTNVWLKEILQGQVGPDEFDRIVKAIKTPPTVEPGGD
jgi:hypothetical protein